LNNQFIDHIGGSVGVLSGHACHSALRCRAGINRGRGYRPGTGDASTALKPATTSGKPRSHEHYELRLEY